MNKQEIDIDDKTGFKQILKNFMIGGLSGMIATTCIQPADMLKTRIQLASEARTNSKPGFVFSKILHKEGVRGFYAGLDSALLRQFIYCGMRLGIYFNMAEHYKRKQGGQNLSVIQKAYCSFVAGVVGSTFCTPCSLVLTRMQADRTLAPSLRRKYKNVFHAFS
jgi:solute carrier family 25 oxoglutarate transporter 11